MKLPLKWLKEYVDFNVSIEEFVARLAGRGFEVAEVIDEMPNVKNIVVCTVLEMQQHPNAEKLTVCRVDTGADAPVQIVTNSKRVYVGAQVPVALDGAVLADGFEIKPTKLRGVESFGMFCGGKEMGVTEADYDGAGLDEVLVFNEKHPNGQRVQEAFDMDSVIFDIELTPNHTDCMSIIGMCREVAAALGQKFNEPVIRQVAGEGCINDYASVTVKNPELCPRYCARVVTDLNIEPSPKWMQRKLKSVGLRPINNIVDITNYVLVEYGHPMHSFDLACVENGSIIVRNAVEGEKVTTLDSKERTMSESMLLIADPSKGVGIAGVMGGENSEITANTKATLFESAVFMSANIRHTAKALHHVTDSAARFIKGVEPVNAMLALNRAIELVEELKAGKVIGGTIDVCNTDINERVIKVSCSRVNSIINLELSPEEMVNMLDTINISAKAEGDELTVTIPHFRTDIQSDYQATWDIAEEIARIYGYDKLKRTLMVGDTFSGSIGSEFKFEDDVKDTLAALGGFEVYNYNFISAAELDVLGFADSDERKKAVRILNPLGEDQSLMRTSLMAGMMKVLSLNNSRKTGFGRFFEVGNIHIDAPELPKQHKRIAIALFGAEESFFTMKGFVEQFLEGMNLDGSITFAVSDYDYFQPGQRALVLSGGEKIGEIGTVHPRVLKHFELPAGAYYAELDFDKLFKLKKDRITYRAIPRYPIVKRDLAVVVEEKVTAQAVADIIASAEVAPIVEDILLFDAYRGKGVPEGSKSLAFSFSLRAEDHTLTDEEITAAFNKIIATLDENGAKLR